MRRASAPPVRMRNLSQWLALLALFAGACSGSDKARDDAAITPSYDSATGKLKELAYDSNHNGSLDTWTDMDGARPVLSRIDRNEDGKVDRWEYYDGKSHLVKVGFSRTDDGKPNAWAFAGPDGSTERIEMSSTGDVNKIDRWEHYSAKGITAAEADTNADGIRRQVGNVRIGCRQDCGVRRGRRRPCRSAPHLLWRDAGDDRKRAGRRRRVYQARRHQAHAGSARHAPSALGSVPLPSRCPRPRTQAATPRMKRVFLL